MMLHPRVLKVQEAGAKIGLAILKVADEYDLTLVEELGCVLNHAQLLTTRLLRVERHPEDPDKKSGLA